MYRKVLRHVFTVICSIGFMVQSGFIAYEYFSYRTTTKVTIETKALIRPPTTTFCARYIDLINQKRLKDEMGIEITSNRGGWNATKPLSMIDIHYKQSHKLTVKNIFDFTPETSQLISDCDIRDTKVNRDFRNYSQSECNSVFNVTKFYMQAFICYNFVPGQEIGSFSIEEVSHSYRFEMASYALLLPRIFFLTRTVYIMLGPEEYPYVSRSYGAYMRTMLHLRMRNYANDYLIQNKVTSINLLPPPYDSKCFVDHDFSLKTNCLIQKMNAKNMNRVPNTEIILKHFDLRHVLWGDELNLTIKRQLDQCYQECEYITKRQKCRYSFSETQVALAANLDFRGLLRLRAMGPHAPNVLVTSHAHFGPSEFFIYVFSCAGIWLGISIVHFNPLLLAFVMYKKAVLYRKKKKLGTWIKVRPKQIIYCESGKVKGMSPID